MMRRSHDAQALDDALRGREPAAPGIAGLVAVATRLCEIAALTEPAVEFRGRLRAELLAQATGTPGPPVRRPARTGSPSAGRRRVRIAAAVAAATLGIGGAATASTAAVPGETLYPVKRAVESMELAMKHGDSSVGRFRLALAAERLAEARTLADRANPPDELIAETLAEFIREAELGTDALLKAFQSDRAHSDLSVLADFTASAERGLRALESRLPHATSAAMRARVSALVAEADNAEATTLARPSGGEPTGSSPTVPATRTSTVTGLSPSPSPDSDPASAPDTDAEVSVTTRAPTTDPLVPKEMFSPPAVPIDQGSPLPTVVADILDADQPDIPFGLDDITPSHSD